MHEICAEFSQFCKKVDCSRGSNAVFLLALLFSATFRKKIEKLARDILIDPIRVVQGDIGEVINATLLLRQSEK